MVVGGTLSFVHRARVLMADDVPQPVAEGKAEEKRRMHERVGRCSPHAAGFEGGKLAAVVNTKCEQRLRTS